MNAAAILLATKLLIVHADDLAMAHSVDAATFKAIDGGTVTSASIIVPAPWLPEVAAYAKQHPDADLGVHLTLTSEWFTFRWRPLTARASLIDRDGFFYATERDAAAHANIRDVEAELRAQIARAREIGIVPTHVDSHMGTLYQTNQLSDLLQRIARRERIPERRTAARIITIGADVAPEKWTDWYAEQIRSIQPGLTVMIVHLGYDDEELRAITANHPNWGAAWRQRDFDFVTSDEFRRLLRENDIRLVTWRNSTSRSFDGSLP